MSEKPDYLKPPELSPLNPETVPDRAFKCSRDNGCYERLSWNPRTQKLECWNPDCDLYAGDSVEKSGGDDADA